MSRFTFGAEGAEEPRRLIFGAHGWMPYDEDGPETPRPDGSEIKETPFGKEINGIPVTEIARIDREARERLNKLDQQNWKHLAARFWKISTIEKPRKRAMVAEALLGGMHGSDPADIEDYAERTGTDELTAAEELSEVGGFEEKPYGIITGEIHFDNDDIPEPEDDDDGYGNLDIASVEA